MQYWALIKTVKRVDLMLSVITAKVHEDNLGGD